MKASNGGIRSSVSMSGGFFGFSRRRSSQVRPVDIRPQVFTTNSAAGFAFDVDGERFGARLRPVGNVAQMPIRGLARLGERVAIGQSKREKVRFQIHDTNNTPSGVLIATPFREFSAPQPNGVIRPVNAAAEIRRQNLRAIVERDGLASTARRFGKPDRQIKDMIMGRKSFGEKVALSMELEYSPNRPPGWLSQPPGETAMENPLIAADVASNSKYCISSSAKPRTERDRRIERIIDVLRGVDDAGIAVVLDKAQEMAIQYPAKKANAS